MLLNDKAGFETIEFQFFGHILNPKTPAVANGSTGNKKHVALPNWSKHCQNSLKDFFCATPKPILFKDAQNLATIASQCSFHMNGNRSTLKRYNIKNLRLYDLLIILKIQIIQQSLLLRIFLSVFHFDVDIHRHITSTRLFLNEQFIVV